MTPKISTYLYVIVAGPYKSVSQNSEQYPPMKLLMRDSLMKKVNQSYLNEIFSIVKKGIDYYEEMFGQQYPFSKYD